MRLTETGAHCPVLEAMMIPQDTPCSECGHARRDHDYGFGSGFESCKYCGCTATAINDHRVFWDPSGPPNPFDWNFALITFLMELESEDGLFTDTIEKWKPGYLLAPGEREDLREVELLVRELWNRYRPAKPRPASLAARNVAEENAAVDRYESAKYELQRVIARIAVRDEWRSYFPVTEHAKIQRVRDIIIAHGGNTLANDE